MFGDDYMEVWPGVCQAVVEFCAANRLRLLSRIRTNMDSIANFALIEG